MPWDIEAIHAPSKSALWGRSATEIEARAAIRPVDPEGVFDEIVARTRPSIAPEHSRKIIDHATTIESVEAHEEPSAT